MKSTWGALVLAAVLASPVFGQTIGTCNGFINLEYTNLADPAFPACDAGLPNQLCAPDFATGQCDCCIDAGQTITVRLQLGTGDILFGTQMDIAKLGFDPDCQPFVDPVCNARPGGPRIAWVDDATITTNCPGTTWSTGLAPGTPITSPNEIGLVPTPAPLAIPENAATPPGFCQLSFDLQIVADPGDTIFQLALYTVAQCNNGNLVSGGRQTSKVQVCPQQGPFIGYEIKDQGIVIDDGNAGTTMDVPILGLIGAPIPEPQKLTAKRLLAPAQPGNIFGDHILGFGGFVLPLPNPKPKLQITAPPLGTFTAQLGGRSFVLINAVKDLNAPVPPGIPLTSVWACYNFAKGTKAPLSWTDQFGPNTGTTKGTTRVCLPASLLGSTPPPVSYLCASNFPATRIFPQFLFVGSAWLTAREHIDSVDDYCAPAVVVVQ